MDTPRFDYDLFVIGAGSGGVRAARIAAGHGARVAIAEEYRVGGTCVVRGCIPKKLLVYASQFSQHFEESRGFGWTPGAARFDWADLIARKDREIDRLNRIYIRNLETSGVEIFRTRARLADDHTVDLEAEGRAVTAATILIATGAWPFVPEFPGAEHAITSNEAFQLDSLPGHITIVGGGYIAVEFAGIFNGLGARTALLYRGPEILRGFDDDLRSGLHEEMAKKGVDVRVMTEIAALERRDGGYLARLATGDALETGLVMYATGRKPNTAGLGLENAGVELGDFGKVVVDQHSRSSVPHIYAVGDVTDRSALTPVAIREGHAFADTVFGTRPTAVDYANIPSAVFSQPEIGTVGLTEAEARDRFADVDIYKSRFRPLKHTLSGLGELMMMKLVVDAASGRVVGCHILGPDAGEMAQLLAISLKLGATKSDFDATIALHPSSAEELVTMREKWQPPSSSPAAAAG
jgi:glutathione reductase (NADPH)